VVLSLLPVAGTLADVSLNGVFGDHMVLQREQPIPIWGWADPGEAIDVSLSGQTMQTVADSSGKWMVRLDAIAAGGPLTLTVRGKNQLVIDDILMGEVWLCSGQSNMAMMVSRAKNFEKEQQNADFPAIRQFKTAAHATPQPQENCGGEWSVCNSENVGTFSAAAYFFARRLHQELGVPIGLLNSSWGGTDIAAWTSLSVQQSIPSIVPKLEAYNEKLHAFDPAAAEANYQAALDKWKKRAAEAKLAGNPAPRKPKSSGDPRVDQNRPANLFNGMIQPLVPFGIRGVIWYQGERNSHSVADGVLYATQLKTLIEDWRSRWQQGAFPFLTVQLPNFHATTEEATQTTGWVMVRDSQQQSLQLENTGVIVTIDVGESNDIHPKDKQTVGERLALWGLANVYGHKVGYCGPMLVRTAAKDGSPENKARPDSSMILEFEHADGLKTSDGQSPRGFAIAGADRQFYPASAVIVDGSPRVILSSPDVQQPVAARYNWADNPQGNLVNAAGLPAFPFRTDSWEVSPNE
jgi:sialate O-acetylesterase